MFNPKLTVDQRRWMLANVGKHETGTELARACAEHFKLIDDNGDVIGDQTVDGDPIELILWTHDRTGEAHPVCSYADALCDAHFDRASLMNRLISYIETGDLTHAWAVINEIDEHCAEDLEVEVEVK